MFQLYKLSIFECYTFNMCVISGNLLGRYFQNIKGFLGSKIIYILVLTIMQICIEANIFDAGCGVMHST